MSPGPPSPDASVSGTTGPVIPRPAGWWRPSQALADWQAGRIDLIEPTVVIGELLSRFTGTDEAMAAIRAGGGTLGGRG